MIQIQNGVIPSSEPPMESFVYPWAVDDDEHEGYLEPATATPRHLPRVIRRAFEDERMSSDWSINGRYPLTSWVGRRDGTVARSPLGAPMVRAVAFVHRDGGHRQTVWCIADGYELEGEIIPARMTLAIGGDLASTQDSQGLAWASQVMATPGAYFLGGAAARNRGLLDWDTDRPDTARDIFSSARWLLALTDEDSYPARFRELLDPFRENRSYAPDGERSKQAPLTDENRAALAVHYLILRALRMPGENGKLAEPNDVLGMSLGKSPASARSYVDQAVVAGVLTPGAPGTGRRYLTPKGDDLATRMMVEVRP